MATRVRTHDETLEDFGGEVWVACPRCGRQALVRVREPGAADAVQLTCTHCGHSAGWAPSQPGKHFDIYSAERQGDGFAPRTVLGAGVNTTPADYPGGGPQDAWDFNPEISVDGHTLLFTSLRPGGYGLGDIYVSHLRDGEWSAAVNVGPAVNSAMDEYHPTLSRNRQTLYFVRRIFRPDPFLFVRGNFYEVATSSLNGF